MKNTKTARRSSGGREVEVHGLAAYLDAVRDQGRLTRKEEHALAVRAWEGDAVAKQKLIRHSLALVVAVALKQRRGSLRLDDLIQEGNVGLVRAADGFDPYVGTRFSTYAVWWVRACLCKYLREGRSSVRPHSGTVAQPDLSLDSTVGDEGDLTYLDTLEDAGPGPEDGYLSAESDRDVRDALDKARGHIGDLGWDVVHSRLQQDPPTALGEIGERWGVSRERVRQVERKTKHFLRWYLGSVCAETA